MKLLFGSTGSSDAPLEAPPCPELADKIGTVTAGCACVGLEFEIRSVREITGGRFVEIEAIGEPIGIVIWVGAVACPPIIQSDP